MFKTIKKTYKTLLVASSFALVGCGGGGSGSSLPSGANLPTKPDSSKMAKLDNDNATQSALYAYRAVNLLTNNKLLKMDDTILAGSSNKNAKKINRSDRVVKQSCESGSIKADVNDKDKTATIYYNNCLSNGATYNGKATYYYYNEDQYEYDFENTTIKSDEVNIDIEKANIYYIGDEPYEMTKVYMSMDLHGKKIEYLNFNYYLNRDEVGVKFNGYVKPLCLDGYLYTETKGSIKFADEFNNLDPIGTFIVKSNKEVKVDLDRDLVYITPPNKTEEVYKIDDVIKALDSQDCSISINQIIPTRPNKSEFGKLDSNSEKNLKILSSIFNTVNTNTEEKFAFLDNAYDDIVQDTECISGDVTKIDNSSQTQLQFTNCKVNDNTTYDGNASYKDDSGDTVVSLNKLKINSTTVNSATIKKKYGEVGSVNQEVVYINNLNAKVANSEYIGFNIKYNKEFSQNDHSKSIEYSGYIKPKCLGKYFNVYNAETSYNQDANVDSFNMNITDKPNEDLSEEEEMDALYASWYSFDDEVEYYYAVGEFQYATLSEFLNECK